jgi:3-deoxy-D-manno-octulosonate 8-phosphate phosphatase (KDO 8-P phosphatase)
MADRPTADIWATIRLLLLDVDGVLTDGRIVYGANGEEVKSFSVRDGLGLRLLMNHGIRVGIVTGRQSKALRQRCRDLKIEMVYDGTRDKGEVIARIIEETGIAAEEIAFVGDDLIDLPAMVRVGLPLAVSDAHEEVVRVATWTSSAPGGNGAVREICEKLLKNSGAWDKILEAYLK